MDRSYWLFALRILAEFGAIIAIPVVLLSQLVRYLDTRWHTRPWMLIAGFALSAIFSGMMIYRKAQRIGREYQQLNQSDKDYDGPTRR